jgi:predicted nucleic acid-binding protein
LRVLFDTNVVLDVLLDRVPFAEPAAQLFAAVERGGLAGLLCGTTITTVHYIARRSVAETEVRGQIGSLISLFEVAPVTRPVIAGALELRLRDFEDAVLHEAARLSDSDGIVTRNNEDFRGSTLRIYTPPELLAVLRDGSPGT